MLTRQRSSIRACAVALVAAATLIAVPAVRANQWNERTIIEISEPVMVPGATLEPGRYVFKLLDSNATRHVVQIFKDGDERQVITQMQAVPTRRQESTGDTVLKFDPTESGTPALKAWFYPGSRYGHRFVYPDRQARDIASRTKTIVLSTDVEGRDMEKGTLHIYDADGQRKPYTPDAQMEREWAEWNQSEQKRHTAATEGTPAGSATAERTERAPSLTVTEYPARARVISPTSGTPESTAPMMIQKTEAMNVRLDQLEDNPKRYIGQTIAVNAEVETVHGPRLFTIDEPNWGDLEGETLVFMPSDLAALVREDDRITLTGTVRPFVKADIEREWGWLDADDEVIVSLAKKPVLVASRIVGGDNNVALSIRTRTTGDRSGETTGDVTVGTSGAATDSRSSGAGMTGTLTDARTIATGDDDLVGRRVRLQHVQLTAGKERGLWLTTANGPRIYVLPSQAGSKPATSFDTSASVSGVVLQMPRAMRTRLNPGGDWNDDVYIYAFDVDR